ncbi:MAG: hypothetical protein BWX66_00723 [Deltaproteobacteria bacterium ADurb.Bin058]|nr:MAG: hypothetical protein BWX66_00723 [Deltaproteobacteria bacterium ADurb.Bin058]
MLALKTTMRRFVTLVVKMPPVRMTRLGTMISTSAARIGWIMAQIVSLFAIQPRHRTGYAR